jgi:transposase
MTFTRRLQKGDNVYVYRVTPYREKGTGKVKQKTEYLGKEIVKDNKTILEPPRYKRMGVRKVLSYGGPMVLYNLSNEFRLSTIIDNVFEGYTNIENLGKKIVTLAINKILNCDGIENISRWYNLTSLSLHTDLSSDDFTPKKVRTIHSLLSKEIPDFFSMIEHGIVDVIKSRYKENTSILVYDLTPITFFGGVNNLARFGYAYKTNGNEKQINLILAITKEMKLPIHHRIVSGNIVSVSTIKRFIGELKDYKMKKVIIIIDRGFYSKRNLDEFGSKYKVIGALSSNLNIYKEAVSCSTDIDNSRNYMKYHDEVLFFKEHEIDGKRIIVYHSPKRYTDEIHRFYRDLSELEEHLKKLEKEKFQSKHEMIEELKNTCNSYYQYFKYEIKPGWSFKYQLKHKAIQRRNNRMGKTVLFTTTSFDAKEILKLYREKDVIDKVFEIMKHHGLSPLKTTTEDSTKAYVNLVIIGYLLLALLRNKLKDKNLSIEKILHHLDGIKEILFFNNSTTIAELTKEQKEIMEDLKML